MSRKKAKIIHDYALSALRCVDCGETWEVGRRRDQFECNYQREMLEQGHICRKRAEVVAQERTVALDVYFQRAVAHEFAARRL